MTTSRLGDDAVVVARGFEFGEPLGNLLDRVVDGVQESCNRLGGHVVAPLIGEQLEHTGDTAKLGLLPLLLLGLAVGRADNLVEQALALLFGLLLPQLAPFRAGRTVGY
jgi:hypothetical protein